MSRLPKRDWSISDSRPSRALRHQGIALIPDDVRIELEPRPDRRSIYSYLGRLARQGLLERGRTGEGGMVAYRLTQMGRARLEYFRQLGE